MKIHIATTRPIGITCIEWASKRLPEGFEISEMEECDIFISVMYDKLIDESFISSKRKCYNIHPGILPQYRGAGSYSWAIINGDHSFGVTLHEIDVSIDHGKIIDRRIEPVYPEDTAWTLYRRGEEMIFDIFKANFKGMIFETLGGEEQDESAARLYYRRDLDRMKDLTKFVRAFTFEGKENAYYYDHTGERHYLVY